MTKDGFIYRATIEAFKIVMVSAVNTIGDDKVPALVAKVSCDLADALVAERKARDLRTQTQPEKQP